MCMPNFYNIGDVTIYWPKIHIFCRFYRPSLVWSPHNRCLFPCNPRYTSWSQKATAARLSNAEKHVILSSLVLTQYLVTPCDGQTDMLPIAKSRIAYAYNEALRASHSQCHITWYTGSMLTKPYKHQLCQSYIQMKLKTTIFFKK